MGSVGLYRSYAALLAGALVPIWTGAHASLAMPASQKRKLKKLRAEKEVAGEDEEDDLDEDEVAERLTREDALWFPIIGSVVLFGLFLLFRFVDKRLLNRILGAYLSLLAIAGLTRSLTRLTRWSVGPRLYKRASKWTLLLTKNKSEWAKVSLTTFGLGAFAVGLALALGQMYTGHWILVNIVALSFAFNAISLIALDSFLTGSILLAGLFVYDVWWVFGSKHVFGDNVMVEVATSFDGPIKIIFPRNLAAGKDFTLLGLGDIVLPGVFLALALRFDYHLALSRSAVPFKPTARFPKPYFIACFVAYILGLATTMTAMHWFRAAQPALLYLSPACILSIALTAVIRGDWKAVWTFTEEREEDDVQERSEVAEAGEGTASEALEDAGTETPKEEGADSAGTQSESARRRRRKTRSTAGETD